MQDYEALPRPPPPHDARHAAPRGRTVDWFRCVPSPLARLSRKALEEGHAFVRLDAATSTDVLKGPALRARRRAHRVVAAPRPGRLPARRPAHRLGVRALGARPRGGPRGGRAPAGGGGLPADRRAPLPAPPRDHRGGPPRPPGRARDPPARGRRLHPRQEGLLLVGVPGRHGLGDAGRPVAAPLPPEARPAAPPRPPAALAQVPAPGLLRLRRVLPDGPGRGRGLPRLALQPRGRREDAVLLRAALAVRPEGDPRPRRLLRRRPLRLVPLPLPLRRPPRGAVARSPRSRSRGTRPRASTATCARRRAPPACPWRGSPG